MKKKALTVILPLCVAMAMTACGGNAETAEAEETAVTVETQAEAEAEEQEEAIESEQTENEASADEESSEEIESGDDGTVNGDEFPIIEQAVIDNDKSDEYGVYSTSCFDLDEFLDEEGMLPGVYETTDWDEYTGRWAYPEITPCKFFDGLRLTYRSDKYEMLVFDGNDTIFGFNMCISSGPESYNYWNQFANDPDYAEFDGYYKYMFTAQTSGGETEVLSMIDTSTVYEGTDVDFDSSDGTDVIETSYLFTVGNFTVDIAPFWSYDVDNPNELSEEDLQLIIDNIHLTT